MFTDWRLHPGFRSAIPGRIVSVQVEVEAVKWYRSEDVRSWVQSGGLAGSEDHRREAEGGRLAGPRRVQLFPLVAEGLEACPGVSAGVA